MNTFTVNFRGEAVALLGLHRHCGEQAPHFTVMDATLHPVSSARYDGRNVIISVFPSVDTPVCALQNIRFNREATALSDRVEVLSISVDMPFAQQRFCAAEGIEHVHVYSDYRDLDFGMKYGFVLEGLRLLARGVVVIDRNRTIRYIEYVPDVSHEPDYEAALRIVKELI